jgi:hypothetical protein
MNQGANVGSKTFGEDEMQAHAMNQGANVGSKTFGEDEMQAHAMNQDAASIVLVKPNPRTTRVQVIFDEKNKTYKIH